MADVVLADRHWSAFNRSGRPVTLYWSNGTPQVFAPGDRYVLPKQVEAINATHEHKATLVAGGFGGGKSTIIEQCAFNNFFEWLTPGHYHGPIREDSVPCTLIHENVRQLILSQTKRDIKLRHVDQILLPKYGEFGEYNQNNFEFTLYPEYGGGVLVFLGTDNLEKLRSMDFAWAGHDECTLDEYKVLKMVLKRLRWFDIGNNYTFTHCSWLGATNTTGQSRTDYRENFVYHPRAEYIDDETGEHFPGFCHIAINAADNPNLDPSYIHELEQGTDEEVDIALRGSWERNEDGMFDLTPGINTIDDNLVQIGDNWPLAAAFDFGWDHPSVMEIAAMNPYDRQIVHNLVWSMDKKTDRQMKIEMYEYARDMGFPIERAMVRVGDISAKRGDTKLKAAGLAESSTWKYFNSPTEVDTGYGKYTIPSFQLRPAWKKRIEGWKTVREELSFDWEWRSPDGIPANMTSGNRIQYITRKPGTVILKSCWQTINSISNLQKNKTVQDDARKTTGVYGPGRGDDEAEDFRYLLVAFRKGLYGKLKEEVEAEAEAYNPRQHRSRAPRRGTWA